MAKRLNSVLGVDIGTQSIKIAEVRIQGGAPTITAIGSTPTPEGAVDHIGVHDGDSVGAALKQLCAQAGASVADAVVSVAGQGSVLVRTLEVPTMNDAELKQHMDWEITRNIPFAESTVVSDFKAFPPENASATNMDVVMAISPQSAVDQLVNVLKKAGRKPAAIDVEPCGIARSLVTSYQHDFPGKSVCVVDVGHKTTSINIYKDGHLRMPRQVPIGGEMFTRAIADSLGVSFEDAEQMKIARGAIPSSASGSASGGFNPFDTGFGATQTQEFAAYNPFAEPPAPAADPAFQPYNPFGETEATGGESGSASADEGMAPPPAPEPAFDPAPAPPVPAATGNDDPETMRLYNAMAGVIDEFVAEVRRSIDYFRSKGGDVDVILLCGGGSKIRGMAPFLQSALGLDTKTYDPLKSLNVSAKRADESVLSGGHEEFAVAVGNGLHIFF